MTKLVSLKNGVARALFLFLLLPNFTSAQVVRGRILDDQSGEPVPAADVALLLGTYLNETVGRFVTDDAGAFVLVAKGGGRFRIKADRIGYEEVISPPFDLIRPDTLEVTLRMAVAAVPLAPLTVTSDRPALLLTRRYEIGGFMERRYTYGPDAMGIGTFLEKEDWENRAPVLLSQLLRGVRGVRVDGVTVRMRTTSMFEPKGCRPEWYLDGQHVRFREADFGDPHAMVRGETMDDLISPAAIAAIEVYHGNSKPPQFMDMGRHPCGAIVIWSG